jgi:hypothetical protein
MRLPWVRFTVRGMMVTVGVVAAVLWPIVAAYRVDSDPSGRWLYHVYERHGLGEYHSTFNSQHPAPFWPRYRRALLGLPWPGDYVCDGCAKMWERVGRIVVTVASPPPTVPTPTGPYGRIPDSDPSMVAQRAYDKIVRRREAVVRRVASGETNKKLRNHSS